MTEPPETADHERTPVKDDIDVETELGFEPAVSATGAASDAGTDAGVRAGKTKRAGKRRAGLRRRLGASAVLLGALASMGGAYAAFATTSGASDTGTGAEDIAAGQQLFQVSCITCHGANLEGINGQGPSLIGVGAAAVYFQVSTGRMPAARQGAYEERKVAKFDEKQTEQIAAYVESVGGGPTLPQGDLRGNSASIAQGGELFRLNCASCHGTTFKGAPLSAGKVAPSLNEATDKQIFAAMLSGPENMPVFSDNEITPDEKRAIIAYVQTLKASNDPGGQGIDRIGPVSEAIVIWVAGVGAVMIAILWIGAKAR
jgi:ubiquinol-cytochrome c reductase cytochrome c subunit